MGSSTGDASTSVTAADELDLCAVQQGECTNCISMLLHRLERDYWQHGGGLMLDPKFAKAQAFELLRLGIAPQDVERSLRWLERTMPQNADPTTWIPTEQDLALNVDAAAVQDARTEWYVRAPSRFKRVLDAR